MTQPLSCLGPGDKFYFNDTTYIVIDNYFLTVVVKDLDLVCALDLDTYKVVALSKDKEVEVVYYYGGL